MTVGVVRDASQSAVESADNPSAPTINYKLVLLGDASVGKSCLVVRFARNEFYEYQEPTIGAAFMTQTVGFGDVNIKFEIWDTAGQERYKSLAPMYYRNAAAALIVYDVTSVESFEGAKAWVQELKQMNSVCPSTGMNVIIALCGNKVDLESSRQVDTAQGQKYANDNGLIFMETSARTDLNVKDVFTEVAKQLPKKPVDADGMGRKITGLSPNSTVSSGWCASCGSQ